MKITTVIASGLIASTLWAPTLLAQTVDAAGPPAEFPPASYKGSQYVDSRGCMYIRAGIDGVVDWVPRLNRQRKHICGQAPTRVAGTTSRPVQPGAELITLPASQQPAQTTAPAAAQTVATTKPATPSAAAVKATPPAPQPAAAPVVSPKPAAVAPAAVPSAPAQPTCPGVSSLSAQYINPGARCGPQESRPDVYVPPQSHMRLTPNSRIMPAHVYQQRRFSRDLEVPAGYRRVWEDDRLNPQRTVRTLKPAVITHQTMAPQGYTYADRADDRHNSQRGLRSVDGDAQMAMVWTNTVPRRLIEQPIDLEIVKVRRTNAHSTAEIDQSSIMRLSTRSAPDAEAPVVRRSRYVRAATFADAEVAASAARQLAGAGLPVRLGNLDRNGKIFKVVLAGPFSDDSGANAALTTVRNAGYPGARLSK